MSKVLSIDKKQVRQSFSSAAESYDALASLQRKVALQLITYLDDKDVDGRLMDLGCGTGFFTEQILQSRQVKQLLAVDIAFAMLQFSRMKLATHDTLQYVCADAEKLPFNSGTLDFIASNLALQWCNDLESVFNGFKRILKSKGSLIFSTFGPATLQELKHSWAEVDDYNHVNSFYSAAEITAFLQQAGFKNIKLKGCLYHSQYPSVMALMQELKGIGAHTVLSKRNRQITRKSHMQAMISAYQKKAQQGLIPATYEIFYVSADN